MNPISLIALGLGGYLLYNWYFGSASATSTTSTSTTPSSTTSTTQTAAVIGPQTTATALNVAAANEPGFPNLTMWVWNYYYQQITGRSTSGWGPGVGPFASVSTTQTMTAAQFISYLQGANLGGLGMIIDLQSLFSNVPIEQGGFGDQEFTSVASGLGNIVDDANNGAGYIDENIFNEAAAFNGDASDPTVVDFYAAVQGQGTN